jgi:hypothetical protein
MARGGETERHARLKELALAWARTAGFALAAAEVRVPRSGFRADVAAARADGTTAVFECKQSRADWRKDAHDEAAVLAELAAAGARRKNLEDLLAVHRPDLRRGEALWPEFDDWDFSALEHAGHHRLLRRLETLRRRRREGTKFSRMARYRCADELYLVLEDDIFARAELPAGWGLLVRAAAGLELRRPAGRLEVAPRQREALRASLRRAAGLVPPAAERTGDELPLD